MKKERVIIETEDGTASNEIHLKSVWELRLKEIAPHYKVKSVKIFKR